MCFLLLLISDSALLPLSATGGGRKATPSSPLFGKKICKIKNQYINCTDFDGADDGARTRYLHLGKVALYQMSYVRILLVPPGGIEPPTRGFSVPCSTD